MVLPGREMLTGAVEVDESYIGGARPGKHGRGADGKAIVAIAVGDRGRAPGACGWPASPTCRQTR